MGPPFRGAPGLGGISCEVTFLQFDGWSRRQGRAGLEAVLKEGVQLSLLKTRKESPVGLLFRAKTSLSSLERRNSAAFSFSDAVA
eukprot:2978732-Amphidinium_carterae.2